MTITATIAGAISMLAQFGMFFRHRDNHSGPGPIATLLMTLLAPLAAMLVQMAISRTREYAADTLGARICGNPHALASALAKIDAGAHLKMLRPNRILQRRICSSSIRSQVEAWTICFRHIHQPKTGFLGSTSAGDGPLSR